MLNRLGDFNFAAPCWSPIRNVERLRSCVVGNSMPISESESEGSRLNGCLKILCWAKARIGVRARDAIMKIFVRRDGEYPFVRVSAK